MAEAVNYPLRQWAELNVFCSDSTVSIDNKVLGREMKRVILNRKESHCAGNSSGGKCWRSWPASPALAAATA
jgi:hypothetical protein